MAMAKVIGQPSTGRSQFEQLVANEIARITGGPATVVGVDVRVCVAGGGNPNPLWVEIHSLTDFAKESKQSKLAQALLITFDPFAIILEFVQMVACWAKGADGEIFQF